MNGFYKNYAKRIFDVGFCIALLVMSSWIILLIVFLYCISLQFPIFFVQQRIGQNEKLFQLVKFRTLKDTHSLNLEERKFWLGNFLRATSLDELPQVINVLKGEMSLIGPRPLPAAYVPLFSETQRKRHNVLPGITGYAQVNGRNAISWPQKFKHDVFYVNNLSAWLDLKIIFKTIVLVLSFKKDDSLNEQKFTGQNE